MGRITSLVYNGIEVCRESKIPVLFISNPGYGKTTLVQKWAEKNNYHVETIIGSSFAKEEVQGYQVNNGKSHLDFLEPYWYTRIINEHESGHPTILFIDEISTAPADVQGSLFRLIFDRCIGNGEKLPEDTLIISAANYKDNLPDFFEITAPALNRFCIINLAPKNSQDMIEEYLSPIEDVPVFKKEQMTDFQRQEFKKSLQNALFEIINSFPKETFDFSAQSFNNIYSNADSGDNSQRVLNFMTGRTVSYLAEILLAIRVLGIKKSDPFISEAIDGLVGLGTNTFASKGEHKTYLKRLHKVMVRLVYEVKVRKITTEELEKMTLTETINKMQSLSDSLELDDENALACGLSIITTLDRYDKKILEYVLEGKIDFIYSEIKVLERLSKISEMDRFFQEEKLSENMAKMQFNLWSYINGSKEMSHAPVLLLVKNKGENFYVRAEREGRLFKFLSEEAFAGNGKPKTTLPFASNSSMISHDCIASVWNGKDWLSLDDFFKWIKK